MSRRKIIVAAAFTMLVVIGSTLAHFSRNTIDLPQKLHELRVNHGELFKEAKSAIIENDQDVRAIGETRKLPLFRLRLTRKDIVHFADLYAKLEDPNFGVESYAQMNLWRNAVLEHDKKTYDVKIKSHGRNPNNHRNGRYISLSVKLPDGEQINNCRRFSLLVRDHFRPEKQVVYDLATEFDLLKNQEQLVRVAINNWDEKLYFFDRRFNDSFMETTGRPSMRLFGYSDSAYHTVKSSINTSREFDRDAYQQRFLTTLSELEYPESQHRPLAERFLALNDAIADQRTDEVERFFDLDYLSSFQAVRMIASLNGHSIGRAENLYVFYDTADGQFYPAITRDACMTAMPYLSGGSPELFIETASIWELPMFRMISRNDRVRQATYKKIFAFIQENQETIGKRHQLIRERFEKLSYFGWSMVGMRRLGIIADDFTTHNLNVLKKYLEESGPELLFTLNDSRISIQLLPHSLSAIRFDQLSLMTQSKDLPNEVNITMQVKTETSDAISYTKTTRHRVPCREGNVDLTKAVADLRFSTGLNAEVQRSPRKYTILFKLHEVELSAENFSIALVNNITGQPVTPTRAALQSAPIADFVKPVISHADRSNIGWRATHPMLSVSQTPNRFVIHHGDYTLHDDLIVPERAKLVIEAGTTLRIAEDKAIACFNGIEILGTQSSPVRITSIKPDKPFGTVGVLGNKMTKSVIQHLHLSNGFERWVNGIYFSGALSLHYNGDVEISDSTFEHGHADDGVNVKYGSVRIRRCLFRDNAADQVDLDICNGIVQDSHFLIDQRHEANGDGLDVSGSHMVVQDCRFKGLADKGMSVGEASNVVCRNNIYESNKVGIAVKDQSNVCMTGNVMQDNEVDVDAFQKKSVFGGATVFFDQSPTALSLYLDEKSAAKTPRSPDTFRRLVDSISKQEANLIALSDIDWSPLAATVLTDPFWRAEPAPAFSESSSPQTTVR